MEGKGLGAVWLADTGALRFHLTSQSDQYFSVYTLHWIRFANFAKGANGVNVLSYAPRRQVNLS
jgi:hypothetical protein